MREMDRKWLELLEDDLRYVGEALEELWDEERLSFFEYFALMDSLEDEEEQ